MSFKKGWYDLPDVPKRCPLCDDKRTDEDDIKQHNIRCAYDGERAYPTRRQWAS